MNKLQKELNRRSLVNFCFGFVYVLITVIVIVLGKPDKTFAANYDSAYEDCYPMYEDFMDDWDTWYMWVNDARVSTESHCVFMGISSNRTAFLWPDASGTDAYKIYVDYPSWGTSMIWYVDGQQEVVPDQYSKVAFSVDVWDADLRNVPHKFMTNRTVYKGGEVYWGLSYAGFPFQYGDLGTGHFPEPPLITSGFQDSLVLTSSGDYGVGNTITFYVGYSLYSIPIPYYLYFWEDVEETIYTREVEYYPMPSPDGVWQFDHVFTYPANYVPMVALGNQYCSTPTASGCVLEYAYSSMLTIEGDEPIENSYDFTFISTAYTNVLVGDSVEFTYDIDESICDAYSGAILFLGHPSALYDSGAVLSVSSGSLVTEFDLAPQPLSDFYCPRIEFECDSGTGYTLYLGGSLSVANAMCVSVYAEEQEYVYPDTWSGGGQSDNFSVVTQTGALFQTDKHLYTVGESVKVKYSVYSNSVITKLRLYPHNLDSLYFEYTGNDITEGYNHYKEFSYATIGEKHPVIKVYSGATITATIYLGGEEFLDMAEVLIVQGSTLLKTDTGLFGLAVGQDVISLPSNANIFMKGFAFVANETIKGLIWFASYAFSKIEKLPVFSYVHNLFMPMSGQMKVLPETYFGYDVDLSAFGDRSFTIDYVDLSDNRDWMLFAVKFIVMFVVIFYTITIFI